MRRFPEMRPIAGHRVAALAAVLAAAASAAPAEPTAGHSGLLEFVGARQDRRFTQVPRRVMAFYYTWYGTPQGSGRWLHWRGVNPDRHDIATSTHYPAGGAYDSHDPTVIDRHIDQAKSCGIDTFICTWWGKGTFDDRAFAKVLDRARAKDFSATIYWEAARGSGQEQIRRAVADMLYVLNTYGSHPAFLKLDGRPVIFVYGRVMDDVPTSAWPEIITQIEREYAHGAVFIADGYREAYANLLDGVHTYNVCGWTHDATVEELKARAAKSYAQAVAPARARGKVACLTVIPGYDDTKIRKPGLNAQRLDGRLYEILWEQAIAADPDWVLITSWNEWHEGSEIEPSREYGDAYLKLTDRYARRFRLLPPAQAAPAAAGPSSRQADELRKLFAGKTVAVLPDWSHSAVFWLVRAGVGVRELAWTDLTDAGRFSAERYPVAIWGGGEKYTRTVHAPGDVDEAIQRYLREGGLLMVLPTAPLPFCYDERGEVVGSAWKFGLPILHGGRAKADGPHGWEEPPAGAKFAFRLDASLLAGLPAKAEFPTSGDLRWRPCSRNVLAVKDEYLPLATLVDEKGTAFGEGIAYVRHTASPPVGGKAIYVWMRMDEVVDVDALYAALFRLAGEKMTRR